jgi:hypothetical protein
LFGHVGDLYFRWYAAQTYFHYFTNYIDRDAEHEACIALLVPGIEAWGGEAPVIRLATFLAC